jgi:leucyl aminopeptidase
MNVAFETGAQAPALVVFACEDAGAPAWTDPAAALDAQLGGALARAAADHRFEGKAGQSLDLVSPAAGVARVLALGLGPAGKVEAPALEKAVAGAVKKLLTSGLKALVVRPGPTLEAHAARMAFGGKLASYRFDAYRTKLKPEQKPTLTHLTLDVADPARAQAAYAAHAAVAEGVFWARDLVMEPANVLHPEEFARRARALADLGVAVEVLGEKEMEALGMGSLLGVGQGSVRESQLVVMHWKGAEAAPLALVGKGVCFDTGGISIKPAGGMEGMKGDMGGAAAVVGAMHAFAKRKAKANVVGIIGLVENMPDGNAQRPGDIVTSMSGQTIEVLNTDAEGRLVLCDAMTYVQRRFKPAAMIDLATLTGAIIISLGHDYAGLFSNDDALSSALDAAGKASGEPVWRLPQGPSYDKLLDSPVADIKNVQASGPGSPAGSITAAQFLGRFVEEGVAWAHIDIAGTAWITGNDNPLSPAWATGYGVRLLNQLVADAYER